jgi:hypothetical protein
MVHELMANNYVNAKVALTTTAATTLYTCPPATTAIVKSILVAAITATADAVEVTITSGVNVYTLFSGAVIGASLTVELLSEPLVVQATEVLTVTAVTANRLHVVSSILEIT